MSTGVATNSFGPTAAAHHEYPGLTGTPIQKTDASLPISTPQTVSARVLSAGESLSHSTSNRSIKPPSQTITIPGLGRPTLRRAAKDPESGLSAYLVADAAAVLCNVTVSLKRGDRLVGAILKGHTAPIVDMEFLSSFPTRHPEPSYSAASATADSFSGDSSHFPDIYTLGTCDSDGVVFLWFLEVVKNALNIETSLRVRRKFSFYSLRKSKQAHYSRIRLIGSARKGNLVLVPNDGSNVRIIRFRCDARSADSVPVIEGPPSHQPPRLMPPTTSIAGHTSTPPGTTTRALLLDTTTPSPKHSSPAVLAGLAPATSHKFDRASSGLDMAAGEEVYDGGEASTPHGSASDEHTDEDTSSSTSSRSDIDQRDQSHESDLTPAPILHDQRESHHNAFDDTLPVEKHVDNQDFKTTMTRDLDVDDDAVQVVDIPSHHQQSHGSPELVPHSRTSEEDIIGHHETMDNYPTEHVARALHPDDRADMDDIQPTDGKYMSETRGSNVQDHTTTHPTHLRDSRNTDEYGADERVEDELHDEDDNESLDYKDAIGQNQAHMAT